MTFVNMIAFVAFGFAVTAFTKMQQLERRLARIEQESAIREAK